MFSPPGQPHASGCPLFSEPFASPAIRRAATRTGPASAHRGQSHHFIGAEAALALRAAARLEVFCEANPQLAQQTPRAYDLNHVRAKLPVDLKKGLANFIR